MRLILGNLVAAVSLVVMLYSLFQPTKKKMFGIQVIENIVTGASTLILSGISGTVVSGIALGRNIVLSKRDTLGWFNFLFSGMLILYWIVGVGEPFSYKALPIFASLMYTVVIGTTKSHIAAKTALFVNALLWAIYNIHIQNYVLCGSCVIQMCGSLISMRYATKPTEDTQPNTSEADTAP